MKDKHLLVIGGFNGVYLEDCFTLAIPDGYSILENTNNISRLFFMGLFGNSSGKINDNFVADSAKSIIS
jgi:hypothetical protein